MNCRKVFLYSDDLAADGIDVGNKEYEEKKATNTLEMKLFL